MSRTDNDVFIMGKVVRGPKPYRIDGGQKLRLTYQVEMMYRNKDKGLTTSIWVLSVGNQAEKDYSNIQNGDIVAVRGRLISPVKKMNLMVAPDPEDSTKLIVIDPEDEDCPDVDDSEIKEITLTQPDTKVLADDVWYFPKFVEMLTDEERKRMFSYKVLKEVAQSLEVKEKAVYDPDSDEDY